MSVSATAFPCNTSVALSGPVGTLEARTTCPTGVVAAATALVCHPHPLRGGTMDNKVVHTLARGFGELGLRTARFNFRGVGASSGEYGSTRGETEDTLAVLEWLRRSRPEDEIWLAGFSFGAYVALLAAARFDVSRLILVAPPVDLYPELGAVPPPTVPTLILQGEQDEIVSVSAVETWCARLNPRPELRIFPGVGHFFHGRLNDLRSALHAALRRVVPAGR